jgi:hypothetical protein
MPDNHDDEPFSSNKPKVRCFLGDKLSLTFVASCGGTGSFAFADRLLCRVDKFSYKQGRTGYLKGARAIWLDV